MRARTAEQIRNWSALHLLHKLPLLLAVLGGGGGRGRIECDFLITMNVYG